MANFPLRLPEALRDALTAAANLAHRSLNNEIIHRLQGSLTSGRPASAAIELLDLPPVVRMRPTLNTGQSVQALIDLTQSLGVERLTLAAQGDPMNDAALVVVLESNSIAVLADNLSLSMARRPRALEIARLMQFWHQQGLMCTARVATRVIPDEQALRRCVNPGIVPGGAYATLRSLAALQPVDGHLERVDAFLELLAGQAVLPFEQFICGAPAEDVHDRASNGAGNGARCLTKSSLLSSAAAHGFPERGALEAAMSLYERRLISYPMSEDALLPSSMLPQVPGMLETACAILGRPERLSIRDAGALHRSPVFVDAASWEGAHHGIVPLAHERPAEQRFTGAEAVVYLLVADQFFVALNARG